MPQTIQIHSDQPFFFLLFFYTSYISLMSWPETAYEWEQCSPLTGGGRVGKWQSKIFKQTVSIEFKETNRTEQDRTRTQGYLSN